MMLVQQYDIFMYDTAVVVRIFALGSFKMGPRTDLLLLYCCCTAVAVCLERVLLLLYTCCTWYNGLPGTCVFTTESSVVVHRR